MSTFDHLRDRAHHAVIELGERVEEFSDCTTISLRIRKLEAAIDELYERLGRVVYHELHAGKDLSDKKMVIIAKIDALFDECEMLKEQRKHCAQHRLHK